jgi:hypothetical protein
MVLANARVPAPTVGATIYYSEEEDDLVKKMPNGDVIVLGSGSATDGTVGASLLDSDETLTVAQGNNRTMVFGVQTTARTKTLSRTGAVAGSWIRIINLGATYDITVTDAGDTSSVWTVGPGETVEFEFDGFVWGTA